MPITTSTLQILVWTTSTVEDLSKFVSKCNHKCIQTLQNKTQTKQKTYKHKYYRPRPSTATGALRCNGLGRASFTGKRYQGKRPSASSSAMATFTRCKRFRGSKGFFLSSPARGGSWGQGPPQKPSENTPNPLRLFEKTIVGHSLSRYVCWVRVSHEFSSAL